MSLIPDPVDPKKGAIDSETGDLLGAVLWIPAPVDGTAPTLAELEKGNLLGYSRGFTYRYDDEESE